MGFAVCLRNGAALSAAAPRHTHTAVRIKCAIGNLLNSRRSCSVLFVYRIAVTDSLQNGLGSIFKSG